MVKKYDGVLLHLLQKRQSLTGGRMHALQQMYGIRSYPCYACKAVSTASRIFGLNGSVADENQVISLFPLPTRYL